MAKLKLPFELEKPSDNEYVTRAECISYGNGNAKEALDALNNTLLNTESYDYSDFTVGACYDLSGTTAPTRTSELSNFSCFVVEIRAGQTINLKTVGGGSSSRAYALTDKQRNILVVAPASADYRNGIELQVTQNGYLYVNDVNTSFTGVSVVIVEETVEVLQSQIDALQSETEAEIFGTKEPMTGTFVQNGLIKGNGTFISYNGFDIYSYAVEEGDTLHIQTDIGSGSSLTDRAQAAAYNDNTFVGVVAEGNTVTDIKYVVPAGVNKICVYSKNDLQSVELITKNGAINDISDLQDKISSINTEMSQIEDELNSSLIEVQNYSVSDFTSSAYYNLTGDIAPTAVTESMAIFCCYVCPIKAGQHITLKTRGSTTGRAYALTDSQRNILVVAPENADYHNGIELQVTQNGYLYVNDVTSYFAQPSIAITGNNMEILQEEIDSLQTDITTLQGKIEEVGASKIFNPHIDFTKSNLRILDIGNSYTVDSTHYLPDLAQAANIDNAYSLYRLVRGGGSYKSWVDCYNDADDRTYDLQFVSGTQRQDVTTGTGAAEDGSSMRTWLNAKWDVIIIHQLSTYAPYYNVWEGHTDGGYLPELIRILKITNPQAQIGFLLVHSYPSTTSGNLEHSSDLRWANIAKSAKWIMTNYGINFIIPYGTAVQNLRQCTDIVDVNELSTDGNHMADGLGDYVAACAYFQQLFGAMRGISVLGNTYRVTVDETVAGQVSVTDATALLAQKAAILACTDMFTLNNPSEVTL